MNWKINALDRLIDYMVDNGTVYAPSGEKPIKFNRIDHDSAVNLTRLSDFSAREIWQPITHYYLKHHRVRLGEGAGSNIRFNPYREKGLIVFGLRPCDIKGLEMFDRILMESDSYRRFRENIIIIGYLCDRPFQNCFCESLGVNPISKNNMDLALYPVEEGYILSAETEKGKELFRNSDFDRVLDPPIPSYHGPQKQQLNLKEVALKIETLTKEAWEEMTFACVNCRVCTYVCPSCHCFTITDEIFRNEVGRAIVWDSCQNKYFTQEASGANPRSGKLERVKNRILHKLKYYADQNGELMCTGCGRCNSGCPSGLNLFKEIAKI